MRLRISHETVYRYETPATYAIQTLRVTPRSSGPQYVEDWRILVSQDCRLSPVEDPFGNLTHSFSIDGPIEELSIVAAGEVLTEETAGIVRGTPERLPLMLYRRETALTRPSERIRCLARDAVPSGGDPLATLHALMRALNGAMRYDLETTEVGTTAAEAFELGHGVCRDFAHVFVAAARSLDIPARTVTGYLYCTDDSHAGEAGHAWAEAHVEGLGWVGFDPTHDVCPTEAYVRAACGLDALDAAPIRGTRYGGTGERLSVAVTVERIGDF